MGQPHVTKHLFVTGGVASSLGKGLTASSLGLLLRSRGIRVTMQKLDPYLNVANTPRWTTAAWKWTKPKP